VTESWKERQEKLSAASAGPRKRGLTVLIGVGLLTVLGAVAVIGGFFLLRGDAPEEVSIEDAVAAAEGPEGEDTADGDDGLGAEGLDGIWLLDAGDGVIDPNVDDPSASFVGFRVDEELKVGVVEAVGRTGAVSGSIKLDGSRLATAEITADMTQIVSNESRRDGKIQGALATATFPTATFVLSEPVDFGSVPAEGTPVEVDASGDLTIHGVTNRVSVSLAGQLVQNQIVVVGRTEIVWADYGVTPPSAPIVLGVSDSGLVELQLIFSR